MKSIGFVFKVILGVTNELELCSCDFRISVIYDDADIIIISTYSVMQ